MSDPDAPASGDQPERTLLAWRRTALALVAAGVLIVHLAEDAAGPTVVACVLVGLGAVVAFVWLTPGRHIAAAALGLTIGVVLLGVLALVPLWP